MSTAGVPPASGPRPQPPILATLNGGRVAGAVTARFEIEVRAPGSARHGQADSLDNFLFGTASKILVSSSQSPSGPAGGAPDGYGPGRPAAGPGGGKSLPHGATPSRCPRRVHSYVTSPLLLRHRYRIRIGVTGGPEPLYGCSGQSQVMCPSHRDSTIQMDSYLIRIQ